jgi:arginine/lysine/ornithine decarboxylase
LKSNQKKGFRRLQRALRKIDKQLIDEVFKNGKSEAYEIQSTMETFQKVEVVYPCYKAKALHKTKVLFCEAAGRVSGEFVFLYPPGIPLIIPGERMDSRMIQQLVEYQEQGLSMQGMHDKTGQLIEVVAL